MKKAASERPAAAGNINCCPKIRAAKTIKFLVHCSGRIERRRAVTGLFILREALDSFRLGFEGLENR